MRKREKMRSNLAQFTSISGGVATSMIKGMMASRSIIGSSRSIHWERLRTSGASTHDHSRSKYSTAKRTMPNESNQMLKTSTG